MQPEQPPVKPRSAYALVGKIFLVLAILVGFGYVVNECHTEQRHVVSLQADSTKKVSIIKRLIKQADDAVAFGNRYKAQRDSVVAASDSVIDKLSYSDKVVRFLRGLVDNKTLPEEVANTSPALTDERVVTAGLKTIERERIERQKSDTLTYSLGVRDAKILDLKVDKLTLKNGLVNIQSKALSNIKGGVWPLNHKRRKQNKEIAQDAAKVLKQSEESELEIISNQP